MYQELLNIDNIYTVLFYIFGVFFILQLLYYWFIFGRFAFYKQAPSSVKQKKHPLSVIIAARDEYENLKKNLPLILEQEYDDYEVVVVNNCSNDNSEYLLKELSYKYKHLKAVTVCENLNFFSGKKFPLALGIKSAKYSHLILTDADCRPKSKYWLQYMQSNFSSTKSIVLGYGGYEEKSGFLNKLIRYDALFIAIQYFSMALLKLPYMGVGRNLAYRKGLFYKANGFSSHYQVASGDDDLFINQIADCKNTAIETRAGSHIVSTPKRSFGQYFRQKRRHFTTGKYYKLHHKVLLGLLSFSRFGFYALLIFLLAINFFPLIVIGIYIIRLTSQLVVFKKSMNKLEEKNLLLISPLLDFIFLFINTIIIISNIVFKTNKWN